MVVKNLLRGAEAFLSGREIARAVASGKRGLGDVERFLREEDAVTVAVAGAGAAATAWVFVKRRELLLLWGLGALVGSGILERAVRRILRSWDVDADLPVKVQVVDEPFDGEPPVLR